MNVGPPSVERRCPERPFDGAWRAVPENLAEARHEVRRYLEAAGIRRERVQAIVLAISEALTNAIRHAYVGRDPGEVRVRARLEGGEILVRVEDDGRGMRPRRDSPGLGLGLPMIATLCDRLDTRSPESGGTQICMYFSRDLPASGS